METLNWQKWKELLSHYIWFLYTLVILVKGGADHFFAVVEVSRAVFLCQKVKFVVMECTWWTGFKDSLTHSLFNQQYFPLLCLNQLTTIDH